MNLKVVPNTGKNAHGVWLTTTYSFINY